MEEGEKARICRYIALDIHKYYSVAAGVAKHIVPVRVFPGKEKTAAKGNSLTAVFLQIVSFQSISPSSLDTEVNR